jgi:glycine oxidase
MKNSVGIVGAGIAGRLLAVELKRRGWEVSLFDKDDETGGDSCTHASAGMLAPSCELESAEGEISALGTASLELWKEWLERFEQPVAFGERGSLVVAHPNDKDELLRLKRKVRAGSSDPGVMQDVDAAEIADLEPSLAGRFSNGLYARREAHLDNRGVLAALGDLIRKLGIDWTTHAVVTNIQPNQFGVNGDTQRFDWVVDCRGMGADEDLRDLRGIRGELLYVQAPEVRLTRPVRLMHPRYPIYIVPRPDQVYLVGATAIESEDYSPITVRSALELLSAAYTVHTGFAEGHLLETVTSCRPAFPDNRPRIYHTGGRLRINGLYRHGFLVSPTLIQFAADYLEKETITDEASPFMREEPS